MLEKVGAAAAAMAQEAERTPPHASLCLHVDGERVTVQLLPDNYHDTMTRRLKVTCPSRAVIHLQRCNETFITKVIMSCSLENFSCETCNMPRCCNKMLVMEVMYYFVLALCT